MTNTVRLQISHLKMSERKFLGLNTADCQSLDQPTYTLRFSFGLVHPCLSICHFSKKPFGSLRIGFGGGNHHFNSAPASFRADAIFEKGAC